MGWPKRFCKDSKKCIMSADYSFVGTLYQCKKNLMCGSSNPS